MGVQSGLDFCYLLAWNVGLLHDKDTGDKLTETVNFQKVNKKDPSVEVHLGLCCSLTQYCRDLAQNLVKCEDSGQNEQVRSLVYIFAIKCRKMLAFSQLVWHTWIIGHLPCQTAWQFFPIKYKGNSIKWVILLEAEQIILLQNPTVLWTSFGKTFFYSSFYSKFKNWLVTGNFLSGTICHFCS